MPLHYEMENYDLTTFHNTTNQLHNFLTTLEKQSLYYLQLNLLEGIFMLQAAPRNMKTAPSTPPFIPPRRAGGSELGIFMLQAAPRNMKTAPSTPPLLFPPAERGGVNWEGYFLRNDEEHIQAWL